MIRWRTPLIDRRTVLAGMAASGATGFRPALAGEVLTAAPAVAQITPDGGPVTPVWAYAGSVPGPELRVAQGSRVSRVFRNGLDQGSSVHWHGIRIDNAMDGVAGLTQAAVEPGGSFDYDFTVPDAGTYWYHPHNRTFEQMARGLYGPLIVEEADPPEVDQDLTLMLDDWRLAEDGGIRNDFGNMHDLSHAGRIGNWVTVNGEPEWSMPVQGNARLRLRLINAANARIFRIGMQGLNGWVVALDGQPLAAPVAADEVTLAPSQRADLIVDTDPGANEALLYSIERGGGYVVASFPIQGQRRVARLGKPPALPANPVISPEGQSPTRTVELHMSGGAMGRMSHAMLNGARTDIRDLVEAGMAWSFNGIAGMPEAPLELVKMGDVLHVQIANDTRWPHAMHLHGHHFQEVLAGGDYGPFRDTVLVQPDEKREIAFVADNPGSWLLHCHMLEHAASGMMTWIEVSA